MGRAPCCDKASVKKGPWSPEEDAKLREYIEKHGTGGNWIALPQKVGLKRCGKSCRLRWLNYLRPNIKHGEFSDDDDRIICTLFANIGSRWSIIASHLPGRTDNDIKNYWNTKLKKKLLAMAPYTPYPKSRPHQVTTFPFPYNNSFLQNPSIPSVYSSSLQSQISSPYEWGNCSFLTTPIRACSGAYGPISPNFTTSHTRGPDGCVGPFHGNCNPVNRVDKSNLLILGGEPSCSSSDGSCISNPVGRGKEMDGQDYKFPGGDQDLCFQGLFINGADENQKFLIGTATNGSSNGCLGENPLDYSIEEIKQLISTNNMCNSLGFLVDEIKTEGRVLD